MLFQGARFLMRVLLPSILSSGLAVNVARLGVTARHTKPILCAGLNVSLQQDWDTCVLSGQPAFVGSIPGPGQDDQGSQWKV